MSFVALSRLHRRQRPLTCRPPENLPHGSHNGDCRRELTVASYVLACAGYLRADHKPIHGPVTRRRAGIRDSIKPARRTDTRAASARRTKACRSATQRRSVAGASGCFNRDGNRRTFARLSFLRRSARVASASGRENDPAGVVSGRPRHKNRRVSKRLPIRLPLVPAQRWSCHSCSYCCRQAVVHLTDGDRKRLVRQGWQSRLDVLPMIPLGRGWVLNKRSDGACVFLDETDRCLIHSRFGGDQKPLACRLFPFSIREVGDPAAASPSSASAVQVTVRFDCPSVARSEGVPLADHEASLSTLAREVRSEMPPVPAKGDIYLQPGRKATPLELHTVTGRLVSWLRSDHPFVEQAVGASRFATLLGRTRLHDVDESESLALMDLLAAEFEKEGERPVASPLPKQAAMLRQLVFAHTEHVGLADMQANWFRRMGKRLQQAGTARRFLRGRGVVPAVPGLCGSTLFSRIAEVSVAREDLPFIDGLLRRYAQARLTGDSVYGDGYYGWPVAAGVSALFLSIAVIGFLSRSVCAAEGRTEVTGDDVVRATGAVDRAATRLPALGTMAERTRIAYLWEDDGIARLVRHFALA